MAKSVYLQVRCTPQERERWQALAEEKNISLSAWVRSLLNAMVERSERDE